ncbi:DUF3093 domain-containing protein [Nocardioides sp. SYSU D00038]|uniref:DUF3093 domain-containing protein n=1 Tax=Nocardioides sp. SYSU D00038 TaxID=2812554 RepID=UPI00196838CB|nr:DUF3093 domain-containing protein [Nocardioides sp. SYSU D00038]
MDAPAYSERLGVPLRWWVQATMLVASLWLAVVVAVPGVLAWVVTAVAVGLVVSAFLSYGGVRVGVDGEWFTAGRARIGGAYVGEAVALDAEQTRRAAGVQADARAYLLLRPYLKRAVRVEVVDPADPTPYWLVSSRHPDELARAIAALRSGAARS